MLKRIYSVLSRQKVSTNPKEEKREEDTSDGKVYHAKILTYKEKCDGIPFKVGMGEEQINICFQAEKKTPRKSHLKELAIFVAYLYVTKTERAYYYLPSGKIIFFTMLGREVQIEEKVEEPNLSLEEVQDIAESEFGGESVSAIELSANELLKRYGKKEFNSLPLLLLVLFALFAFMAYQEYFQGNEIKKTPPRPNYPPLSIAEKIYLKNLSSKNIIDFLEEEIHKYKTTPNLIDLRRVITFNLSEINEVPPVQPTLDEDRNQWVFDPPFPKRGGVEYSITYGTEQKYPGIGYTFKSEGIYGKEQSRHFALDERNITVNVNSDPHLYLTGACVKEALHLPGDAFAFSRDDRKITFIIKKLDAKKVISKLREIIMKCPAYLTEVNLDHSGFRFKLNLERTRQ
jgi:hypothetical protein